jgi:hypothetical protein
MSSKSKDFLSVSPRFVSSLVLLCLPFITFGQIIVANISGNVIDFETRKPLLGTTLYLTEAGITKGKIVSDASGAFLLNGRIGKDTAFIIQASKPGYVTKNVLVDLKKMKLARSVSTIVLNLMDEFKVEMIPLKSNVSIPIGEKQFVEKFVWDQNTSTCVPDEKYKKIHIDTIVNTYRRAEQQAKLDAFKKKSAEFEAVKDYTRAIQFIDSAAKVGLKDDAVGKKKNDLVKLKDLQDKEVAKAQAIEKLVFQGDSLLALFLWKDAEVKYQSVLKLDPASAKAKAKIASIKSLKDAEDKRNKDLATYKANREACTKAAASGKYSEALTAIKKCNSLTTLPTVIKDQLPKTIDSLDRLLAEDNLKNSIKKEIQSTPKGKTTDITKLKSNYERITSLIQNLKNPTSQTELHQALDKLIIEGIEGQISLAYDFHSKKQYDKAMASYEGIKPLIEYLVSKESKAKYATDIEDKINDVKKTKIQDEADLAMALTKAKNALDSASFSPSMALKMDVQLNKVATLLKTEPFKSRASLPEVKAINDRYMKISSYFKTNNPKVSKLNDKDPKIALKTADEMLALAGGAMVGSVELNFLTSKREELNAKVNPTVSNTVSNKGAGTILAAPGKKVSDDLNTMIGNVTLQHQIQENNAKNQIQWLKNEAEIIKVNEANELLDRQRNEQKLIQANLTEATLLSISDQDVLNARIQDQKKLKQEGENAELARNDEVEKTLKGQEKSVESSVTNLVLTQIKNDSMVNSSQKYNAGVIKKNQVEMVSNEEATNQLSKERVKQEQQSIKGHNTNLYRADSANYKRLKDSQKLATANLNARPEPESLPNYLRDESGNCFPWNKVTEDRFQVESKEGEITSIIVRRVVVNAKGYGMVYQQMVGIDGQYSYTLNGRTISQAEWVQGSNGSGMVNPTAVVQTNCP